MKTRHGVPVYVREVARIRDGPAKAEQWSLFYTGPAHAGEARIDGAAAMAVAIAKHAVQAGKPVREAVVEAAQTRLRPIWVTDLTMMAGAFAIQFDPIFQGMAISLLFGPIIVVPLTLLVIPLGCIGTGRAFQAEAARKSV